MSTQSKAKIWSSLVKVINTIENPKNTATNVEFGDASYAPLSEVISVIKKGLSKEKLTFTQVPEVNYERLENGYELGIVKITTMIIDDNGETLDFPPVVFKASGNTPQAIGSTMTYAKRYSLTSIFGIAGVDEDDDGNAGSENIQPIKQNNAPINQNQNNNNKLSTNNNQHSANVEVIKENEKEMLLEIATEISNIREVEVETILTALGKPLDVIPSNEFTVYKNRLESWLEKATINKPKETNPEPKQENSTSPMGSYTVKAIQPKQTPDRQEMIEIFVEGSNRTLICLSDQQKNEASKLEVGDTFTGEVSSDGVFLFLDKVDNVIKSA